MVLRPAGDPDVVCDLLERAGLPTAGVADGGGEFWVLDGGADAGGVDDGSGVAGARAGGDTDADAVADDPVGCVGLERHGDVGLLRSLAVRPDRRGEGLGSDLVAAIEREASARGLGELYLLTTDAAEFFAALGYERVRRESVPEAIRESEEFADLCPDSAVAMRTRLG